MERSRRFLHARAWIFIAAFLAVMTAGLLLGDYKTVLAKAVAVCLNCIGIG